MQITKTTEAYNFPLLLNGLLEAGVRKAPEQQIHYSDQQAFTYRQMSSRINQLASVLTAHGVSKGQTVAVMDWDSHRYLECFFAIPMLGAVLHTINVRLSPEQILYTINHAEDDVILVNSEFLPVLESIWSRIETVKKVIILSDTSVPATSIPNIGEYEALLAAAPTEFAFADFDENTRATTFYTTGTTGLPKGVYFSHRQLVMHTMAMRSAAAGVGHGRFNSDDVYMPMTPMFHVHAWGAPLLATMMGVKQVYPGRYEPAKLLQLIQDHQVSFTHCVPTILQMLLNAPGTEDLHFNGLKMIIGGSALAEPLAIQALKRGIDVFTGYGMSETCPILTLSHLQPEMESWSIEEQARIRCKTGKPIELVSLRIVDEHMQDVPHDGHSQGEVVVRAPWLTQSYLKDEEGSKQLWAGGWLHTGDMAVMDAQGYLKITDRIKDVIKTGGEWVSSLEIENILLQHAQIKECAVIGVPDAKWGERPLAVLVSRGQALSDAELAAFMQTYVDKGLLSKYGVPDRFIWTDEIPKTSVGKLNKKLMREQYI